MANVNVSCGIDESLTPIVNLYVQESPDSTGYVLTFPAAGALSLATDIVRQAAKAQITAKLYDRMKNSAYSEDEIKSLLEGVGDD